MNVEKYRIGEAVEGTIKSILSYGVFVALDDNETGFIHISQITNKFVADIHDYLNVGMKVIAKIIEIDKIKQHLNLSLLQATNLKKIRYNRVSLKPYTYKATKLANIFNDVLKNSNEIICKNMKEGKMIKTELKYADIKENDLIKYQGKINEVHKMIQDKTGKGSDFLGWKDWPLNYDKNEIEKIKQSALRIQETSQVLVVCGIGGSYLGAVSGIELLKGIIPNKDIEIIYFGNTFSSLYVSQVLDYLKNKSFSVNVISKSGTTTETSIAFRLLKQLLKEKYGEDYYKRIYATTDKYKGTLKAEADLKGYETFTIPDDIGGRFSVLTSVGLLPFASAKLDIEQILLGAQKARIDLQNSNILENESYKYAVARYILLEKGYKSELYVTYEPHLAKFSEWLKQLFGESEGKDGKALLPDSVLFSTDLHSLGQFIQDGSKMLFETNIRFEQPLKDIIIPSDNENLDNLNYLQDKSLNYVNEKAFLGTLSAHYEEGKVPNIILSAQEINEFTYGYLVYFFFISCATSAYLLDVNPFNQPGVEIYKKKMFELLGKPK